MATHHVYPTWGRAHRTDGPRARGASATCWCGCRVVQMCPVCSGGGCGHCEGGEVAGMVAAFSDDPGWPTLVIHDAGG